MMLSLGEITVSREVGEGRVRVEEHSENYDAPKNLSRATGNCLADDCFR
jgi:hypothetical protein